MSRSSYLSGHVQSVSRPCTIHGLYNERTGTLIFESVWCDGENFYAGSFDVDELNKYFDELYNFIVNEDF